MYEEHFGLNSRPFGAKAVGKDVFVGPGQTNAIARLHKGLTLADSVVTVTGMVGAGKTTVVNRSLETIVNGRVVIWIGRMQLDPDELMALLLAGFGVSSKIKGTVRKFATFKRLLLERAATVAPVAIVVEDAQRIGVDALAELEALTAADAGDGSSANIILMGQTSLNDFLLEPDLARLKQRVRLRQNIEPLTAAEVQGYLKHCIREAGGNYDLIFAAGVADLVYQCSGGIPRVINNVCEAAMTAAMDKHSAQVTAALFSQVAEDTLGYVAAASEAPTAIDKDEDVDSRLVDSLDAEESVADTTPSISAVEAAVPQDDPESQNEQFQQETDAAISVVEDELAAPDDEKTEASAEAEQATPDLNEAVVLAAVEVKASTDGEPKIDWDAIAPPALPSRNDNREKIFSTKEPSQEPANVCELIVESGNHPNIDDVISAGDCAVESTPPTQECAAESQPEASEVTDTGTRNDSPEFNHSALPDLINDTQPELRELPDITDEAAIAINIPTLPEPEETANDAQSDIPTLVPGIGSTQRLQALDPANFPVETIAGQEKTDRAEPLKEDELRDLDAALSVESESTNVMAGITSNLDDVSGAAQESGAAIPVPEKITAEESIATNAAPVATTDAVKTGLKLDEMGELVSSDDNAESGDTTTSLELPTLSDSMRIAIALDDPDASEITKSPVDETDAAPEEPENEILAESPPPSDPEVDPALALDVETKAAVAKQVESTLALSVEPDSEIDEEEAEAGIFDQLDPMPDLDASYEAAIQASYEPSSATFADDDGSISVPNLTIANNFDKSKNDIDALEAALEDAKQGKISAPPPIKREFPSDPDGSAPVVDAEPIAEAAAIDIPQITLDNKLQKQPPPPIDMEQLAQEIGTAESLEDFSASMAETLFGSDAFDQIAAHVVANPPAGHESPVSLVEDASPVQLNESEIPAAANDKDENVLALEPDVPVVSAATGSKDESPMTLESAVPAKPAPGLPKINSNPPSSTTSGEMDINASMAMRIDILNKAKRNVAGMAVENVELGELSLRTTSDGMEKPESIENQINTSITQTLKAIDIKNMAKLEQEEKSQKKSGGLFSRFRKSS